MTLCELKKEIKRKMTINRLAPAATSQTMSIDTPYMHSDDLCSFKLRDYHVKCLAPGNNRTIITRRCKGEFLITIVPTTSSEPINSTCKETFTQTEWGKVWLCCRLTAPSCSVH